MKNVFNNKGISLVSLVITVIVILILSSIIVLNINGYIDTRRLDNMYTDIDLLEDKVLNYYAKYGKIPVLDYDYPFLSKLTSKGEVSINIVNPNDSHQYAIIDLNSMEGISLNFGKDFGKVNTVSDKSTLTDIYIIDKESLVIYYVKGINVKEKIYYGKSNNRYTKVTTYEEWQEENQ